MAQAIKTLYGVVKTAALFLVRRPKDAAFVILAILFVFMFWRLRREQSHAQELATKTEGLPPDTKQTVTVYRDRIIEKWRTGPARVEYRERYLPPEGHIELVTKENASEKLPEIAVKDWGFTARLGGGMVYSGKVLPVIDLKWFYWRRYSMTTGISPKFIGIGISRHIDDFTPFRNIEIVGIAGATWTGSRQFSCGIRFNF
ncbi:MAG: hypothetical protein WCW52_03515 [Elusimicrobiales bacterium]|jgi:hypothetical protein